jgi:hypothetical protein
MSKHQPASALVIGEGSIQVISYLIDNRTGQGQGTIEQVKYNVLLQGGSEFALLRNAQDLRVDGSMEIHSLVYTVL